MAGKIFLEACETHGKNCEIPPAAFDIVVASCGGYPKDINFIQSHKAVHNAAMFVRDGGLLLLYAEMPRRNRIRYFSAVV